MKILLPLFVVYFYSTGSSVFFCQIKYKKEGTTEVKTESCLWDNNDTLQSRLEALTGDVVELVKVDKL